MRHEHVVGDMRVIGEGTVDGWCWAPDRPQARIAFDILVDDRLVASGEAALPRADLTVRGMEDKGHGFRLQLPPGSLDPGVPCLVSARARDSAVVFGRRLLRPPGPVAADPAPAAMQAALGELSERLSVFPAQARPPAQRLRAAAGHLAAVLQAGPARPGVDVAASRRVLAATGPLPKLARPAAPRATLVLRAGRDLPETLARLHALAPATHALAAETMLLDAGADARGALLPSLVPGLMLAASWAEAAKAARGAWLLLLEAAVPSAAGLEFLLARLEARAAGLALAARLAPARGLPTLVMAAPTGVTLAVRRSLVEPGDDVASLARRLAGRGVALVEPWP